MKTEIKKGVFVGSSDSNMFIVQFDGEIQVRAKVSEELLRQSRPGFSFRLQTGNEVLVEMPKPNPKKKGKIVCVIG